MDGLTYDRVRGFLEHGQQQPDFDFVSIGLEQISSRIYPEAHDHTKIYQQIDRNLSHHHWSRSFERPQVLYTWQEISVPLLEALHAWLRQRACDITNIWLVQCHHTGLASWWQARCAINHQRSFNVVDWLNLRDHAHQFFYQHIHSLPPIDHVLAQRLEFQRYFSWYGGGSRDTSKYYSLLRVLELSDIGHVEMLGRFQLDRQQIINEAEYLSYFHGNESDHMAKLYDRYVRPDGSVIFANQITTTTQPRHNESIDYAGYHWQIDRHCFAALVRETSMNQPFACQTEKTMRAFLYHQAVMPITYHGVEDLEAFGFWFPHDIIDYGYQHEPDYLQRLDGALRSMRNLADCCSLGELHTYFLDNLHHFRHNATLCLEYHAGEGSDVTR